MVQRTNRYPGFPVELADAFGSAWFHDGTMLWPHVT
jgi:hypothetical protein